MRTRNEFVEEFMLQSAPMIAGDTTSFRMADHVRVCAGKVYDEHLASLKAESTEKADNSGSPKCYCCGSENVIIECGSCKERRVFGTWSSQ